MKYITDKTSYPPGPHFAAIVFGSVFIPGDERSRTNPGHGYPDEHRSIVEYIAFQSRDEMEQWVAKQEARESYSSRKDYRVFGVTPMAVAVKASVEVR